MFERKEADTHTKRRRSVVSMLKKRNRASVAFLFCVLIISGCATASPTSATQPQPQVQTPAVPQPFHTTLQTFDKDFSLTLAITPDRSGTNTFVMGIIDNHTNKSASHVTVILYTTMQDMAMGTDSLVLHANNNGQFSATSNLLSMRGHWGLGITIQTSDHVVHKAGVDLVLIL